MAQVREPARALAERLVAARFRGQSRRGDKSVTNPETVRRVIIGRIRDGKASK
jgi:hypothetical protein